MSQPSALKIPSTSNAGASASLTSSRHIDSASTVTAEDEFSPLTPQAYSPDSTRDTFPPLQGVRRAQPGRALGTNVASAMLDAPYTKGPYGMSPGSSVASLSHGNLLETASMTSSALESTSEAGDETGPSGNLTSRGTDSARERKASRHNRLQNMLSRSRSTKPDENHVDKTNPKSGPRSFDPQSKSQSRDRGSILEEPPQTAPMSPDRTMERAMDSSRRNRSAERATPTAEDTAARGVSQPQGSGRFANFFASSSKVAGDLGRVSQKAAGDLSRVTVRTAGGVTQKVGGGLGNPSKGIFGKMGRAGGSEHDIQPEKYQLRLINQPLIQQTRMTRLQRRMADAKDKTEFWMPALPYRCIDYLNSKGVETEGLYRVPGAVKDIKYWQMRFDQGEDINLLDTDLEDVHTVGSILKAWLRELPDELLPKETQTRIARECAASSGGPDAPQMLKDELSKLSPFQYYLLFAVTAHVALLSKFSDINKMTFNNLCICFQPCLGIDAFSFHFLVRDWRNCWQGCETEKLYLEEEYRIMEGGTPSPQSPLNAPPPLRHTDSATSTTSATSRPKTAAPGMSAETDRRTIVHSPDQNHQRNGLPSTPPPPSLSEVVSVSPMKM